ncbi:hypothetical protein GCM10007385_35510 [Tateyamaria omphalii]|uniref:hypothetical protein n=1 Tax=Tateyamaria omphalii TaxID=299262 RepID=UPI0016730D7F|nr:hypothetical protein [Tateyamaria omphalii]GGX63275.1 hypothetical protein GCM10007385_35510 [Tateyamaria omphalii]
MATVIDAQNALLARLQAMPDRPAIAYPNDKIVEAKPRIVVQFPAAAQTTRTIGGCSQGDAEMVARIETKQHELTTEANTIAEQIIAWFRPVQRFGGVTIIEAPSVRAQFSEAGSFHLPVIIRGRFYT